MLKKIAWKRAGTLALVLCAGTAWGDARLEARRHFRTAMSLIAQGQYDSGIAELLDAYSIKPHANVLYNIARAYQDAGRVPEAVDYYRRYLAAKPPDSAPVVATLAKLEETLGDAQTAPAAEGNKSGGDAGRAQGLPPMPPPPATTETTKTLVALMERLEKAIARAEALPAAPGPTRSTADAPGAAVALQTGTAPGEDEGEVPYEERVVTASRRAQSSLEAPNATTVITAEDIRLSGARSLPELLRRGPGAEGMMMGPGSANVSLRGFNQRLSNKVLVLVDGRSEYQDFLGMTLWSSIPVSLDEIERIEVIRGPGSALYGANAMLGVVNIITQAPGTGPRARFQGYAGSGNVAGGDFVSHGGSGALRYRASVAYTQANKWSRDFASDRPDMVIQDPNPDLGVRSTRATLATTYQFHPRPHFRPAPRPPAQLLKGRRERLRQGGREHGSGEVQGLLEPHLRGLGAAVRGPGPALAAHPHRLQRLQRRAALQQVVLARGRAPGERGRGRPPQTPGLGLHGIAAPGAARRGLHTGRVAGGGA